MEAKTLSQITANMPQLVIVDSVPLLATCLAVLSREKVVFIAAKSPFLGRGGSISILQLSIIGTAHLPNSVFLIDVYALGSAAFGRLGDVSLGEILSSRTILKVGFDCRNLADALYHLYQVMFENVLDMQCMHMLHTPTARYLTGFFKVLSEHAINDTESVACKDFAELRSFYLEETERRQYQARPLQDSVMAMCLMDILWFDALFTSLQWDLTPEQLSVARDVSEERLACRHDSNYEPQAPERKLNNLFHSRPWLHHPGRGGRGRQALTALSISQAP